MAWNFGVYGGTRRGEFAGGGGSSACLGVASKKPPVARDQAPLQLGRSGRAASAPARRRCTPQSSRRGGENPGRSDGRHRAQRAAGWSAPAFPPWRDSVFGLLHSMLHSAGLPSGPGATTWIHECGLVHWNSLMTLVSRHARVALEHRR